MPVVLVGLKPVVLDFIAVANDPETPWLQVV